MATARDRLLLLLGPGWYAGITTGDWLKLLYDNNFAVDIPYWPRAAVISMASLINTMVRWPETLVYSGKIRRTEVEQPLFILGHPRSGTSHLHNLLSLDDRYAYPNFFEVNYPSTFLLGEPWAARLVEIFVPKQRFMDNMSQSAAVPYEEEWAMCMITTQSPYVGWTFTRRLDHYEKYWTLRDLPQREVDRWKNGLMHFLKKVTIKYKKPLILKSPPHTCRIKLLLEMFPNAKFVSIRRDPFAVFQSTRHLWAKVRPFCQLQKVGVDDADERILRQYRSVYDAYFEEKGLIPPGNLHELAYEDLEKNPEAEMRRIYEALNLPDYATLEPKLQAYLTKVKDYQKNRHTDLPADLKARIAKEWQPCFEAWGYPTT